VLITGANAGIGKELARQLGARPDISRVYLGVRNRTRGEAAQAELEASTGRRVYELSKIDVTDLKSVAAAITALPDRWTVWP
jgi:NADP-dependent 3-hydroxy acid dehydrogenase YdfG